MNMFNGNLAPGGTLKVVQARRRQVRGGQVRLSSPLGLLAKSRSRVAPQNVPPDAAQKSVPAFVVPRLNALAPAPELSRDERFEQDSLFSMYVREVGQVAL